MVGPHSVLRHWGGRQRGHTSHLLFPEAHVSFTQRDRPFHPLLTPPDGCPWRREMSCHRSVPDTCHPPCGSACHPDVLGEQPSWGFPSARLHGGLQMPSWPPARTSSSSAVPREFLGPLLSQLRGERPTSEVAVGSGTCQEKQHRRCRREGRGPGKDCIPSHVTGLLNPPAGVQNCQEGKSQCGDEVDQQDIRGKPGGLQTPLFLLLPLLRGNPFNKKQPGSGLQSKIKPVETFPVDLTDPAGPGESSDQSTARPRPPASSQERVSRVPGASSPGVRG